jgi:HlyD family secretion protein
VQTNITQNKSKKRTNRKYIVLGLLLLVMVLFFYISSFDSSSSTYQSVSVDRGIVEARVLASGTIKPRVSVKVGSEISGTILNVFTEAGSHVVLGQKLAEIESTTLRARLAEAQASLVSAKADVVKAQASIERATIVQKNAGADLIRKNTLLLQGYISKQAYAAAENNYAVVKSDHEAALADQQRAKAIVNQARSVIQVAAKELDKTIIRSPISGVVTSRKIEVGQTLAAIFQTPELFTIVSDLSQLKLEADINEADIGRVSTNQTAIFSVDAFPNKKFKALVREISNDGQTLDNGSHSYKITLDVKSDTHDGLLPNMSSLIEILVASRVNAIRVPNAALLFTPKATKIKKGISVKIVTPDEARKLQQSGDVPQVSQANGKPVVWLLDPSSSSGVKMTTVELGIRGDDYTEIIAGDIKLGDKIAVAQSLDDYHE